MRLVIPVLFVPMLAGALFAGCSHAPRDESTPSRGDTRAERQVRPAREEALNACNALDDTERGSCIERVRAVYVQQVA